MDKISRYSFTATGPYGRCVPDPDPSGGWVKFEDHEQFCVERMTEAHGMGQESTIRDVNMGIVDDMIASRLRQEFEEGVKDAERRLKREIRRLEDELDQLRLEAMNRRERL